MKFRYEGLEVGKLTLELVDEIYEIATSFPVDERFGLKSQLQRAVISIYLNLAEGSARKTDPEFAGFISISQGSLMEVHACIKIALRMNYLNKKQNEVIQIKIEEIWIKLCALWKSQKYKVEGRK